MIRKEKSMIENNLMKEYTKIPINCQICEFFLEDDDFIKDHETKFVCSSNNEINTVFLEYECDDFEIGKWKLVDFLKRILNQND